MAGQRSVSLHLFRKKLQRRRNGKKVNNILAQKKNEKIWGRKIWDRIDYAGTTIFFTVKTRFLPCDFLIIIAGMA